MPGCPARPGPGSRRRNTRTEETPDDRQPTEREAETGPQAAGAQAPRARGPVRHRGRGPARRRPRRGRRATAAAERGGKRPGGRRGRARAARLGLDPRIGDPGHRGLGAALGTRRQARPASTCTGSATPATSAPSSAPRTPCSRARSRSGPAAPIPSRRRRRGRAWARSSGSRWSGPWSTTRLPRGSPWSPTAARGSTRSGRRRPSAWAPSAKASRRTCSSAATPR